MSDLVGNPEDRFSRVEAQFEFALIPYVYEFNPAKKEKKCDKYRQSSTKN